MGSHPVIFSSSSSSPRKILPSHTKGKEPLDAATALNSPVLSPSNLFDSDLDFLLSKKSLELEPMTIHKPHNPSSPFISPNFAKNIIVRKKHNSGSRHFRGRTIFADGGVRNLSLVDVPISVSTESRPLRASMASESSK